MMSLLLRKSSKSRLRLKSCPHSPALCAVSWQRAPRGWQAIAPGCIGPDEPMQLCPLPAGDRGRCVCLSFGIGTQSGPLFGGEPVEKLHGAGLSSVGVPHVACGPGRHATSPGGVVAQSSHSVTRVCEPSEWVASSSSMAPSWVASAATTSSQGRGLSPPSGSLSWRVPCDTPRPPQAYAYGGLVAPHVVLV
jgi:hypothetical protein